MQCKEQNHISDIHHEPTLAILSSQPLQVDLPDLAYSVAKSEDAEADAPSPPPPPPPEG